MKIDQLLGKNFNNALERFEFIRENKDLVIRLKKSQIKHADVCSFMAWEYDNTKTVKAQDESGEMYIKVAINTTNWLDSHQDVHIPGLWNKSLKDKPTQILLEEHQMKFDNIISDSMSASAPTMSWKDLGYDLDGETQVLLFEGAIFKDDHPKMYNRYARGKVKQHSVGMQYVKIFVALNSTEEEDAKEKAVWDKYISQVHNPEKAIEDGFFFAVTEAKIFEGSAVVMGSNSMTPTLEAGQKSTPVEPDNSAQLFESFKNVKINL